MPERGPRCTHASAEARVQPDRNKAIVEAEPDREIKSAAEAVRLLCEGTDLRRETAYYTEVFHPEVFDYPDIRAMLLAEIDKKAHEDDVYRIEWAESGRRYRPCKEAEFNQEINRHKNPPLPLKEDTEHYCAVSKIKMGRLRVLTAFAEPSAAVRQAEQYLIAQGSTELSDVQQAAAQAYLRQLQLTRHALQNRDVLNDPYLFRSERPKIDAWITDLNERIQGLQAVIEIPAREHVEGASVDVLAATKLLTQRIIDTFAHLDSVPTMREGNRDYRVFPIVTRLNQKVSLLAGESPENEDNSRLLAQRGEVTDLRALETLRSDLAGHLIRPEIIEAEQQLTCALVSNEIDSAQRGQLEQVLATYRDLVYWVTDKVRSKIAKDIRRYRSYEHVHYTYPNEANPENFWARMQAVEDALFAVPAANGPEAEVVAA